MRIDAHQHFWNLEKQEYPWLNPSHGPLYRTYEPEELAPLLKAAGVEKTVLVQAANSHEDTEYMLGLGAKHDWIGGVVGWVKLDDPLEAGRRLERFSGHPLFKGVRHLIHDEPDPDWVIRKEVVEGLRVLASYGLPFDVVAVFPNHLKHIPYLAERIPELRMVIDHLAKPPIKDKGMEPWASQLAQAAQYPQVYAKISGLNTAADWEHWSAADLQPYVDYAFEQFGADRLMFGSDWPVSLLAGDYAKVWEQTGIALRGRTAEEQEAVLGGTAARFYGIRT
ncbi:hypothetical protein PM3016_3864 [Paenibacillus mucilaginosus 3016]|uniref:Amidohydrolase-related domain-containing protein n=2 Tax=Paenibacillus mucilaginosus TaxID=61624 RepID=H6NDG0_9BACL|nr:amidohydrolase family protein [Paenibacillus mucilaginosus]AFC30673.1 hypothetical protein PM3016_3864 [Paenibacillus mucilaginosus 3016]AFH62992.1 hypothetical protein B2K_20140 [Paenibacillus mucilaginosus K02]WFA19285.1 hypothetical protein ERY13_19535 [Paenibacillus mucilaginosus]